jgi:hypothetical protein
MWSESGDELMPRLLLAGLCALMSGCSLTALEEDTVEPAKNRCEADTDCPGGACDTGLGVCKGTEGSFSNILLEVTPPTSVAGYGSIGFLKPVSELALEGGSLEVNIDVVAKVVGTVTPTQGNYNSCVPHYGNDKHESNTAPVKVTFTPTAKLLGLSTPSYVAKATWDDTSQTYQFVAWMPADTYDVYVQADPDTNEVFDDSCTIAPQFVYDSDGKEWEVPAGDFTMPLVLQPANQLSVTVPSPVDLTGWTVEIVHPGNGKLLSSSPEIGKPITLQPAGDDQYVADIEYSKLWDPAQAGKELVRIRPTPCSSDDLGCTETFGPTLVVQRSAVEWAIEGQATIDQLSKLDVGDAPDPKFPTVKLKDVSLLAGDGFYDGSASVRFVSKEYGLELRNQSGPLEGVQAFFDRTITTESDKFDVELLPGDYDVYVAPNPGSDFATTHAELLVKLQGPPGSMNEVQSGKSITLAVVSHVNGTVATPAMDPAIGAQIQAVASPLPPTPLQIAAGATPFKPQALSGNVDENGAFALQGDPGTLDFSVRPADGTAFPWLVRTNVEVPSGPHDLGEMQIAWPIIYTGEVFLPGEVQAGGAGGALIRAYIYLDKEGYTGSRDGATSVVQIAETRSDENGSFRLFLPPHLN